MCYGWRFAFSIILIFLLISRLNYCMLGIWPRSGNPSVSSRRILNACYQIGRCQALSSTHIYASYSVRIFSIRTSLSCGRLILIFSVIGNFRAIRPPNRLAHHDVLEEELVLFPVHVAQGNSINGHWSLFGLKKPKRVLIFLRSATHEGNGNKIMPT